jgi:hypothetical protein
VFFTGIEENFSSFAVEEKTAREEAPAVKHPTVAVSKQHQHLTPFSWNPSSTLTQWHCRVYGRGGDKRGMAVSEGIPFFPEKISDRRLAGVVLLLRPAHDDHHNQA